MSSQGLTLLRENSERRFLLFVLTFWDFLHQQIICFKGLTELAGYFLILAGAWCIKRVYIDY